jgi:N-formylglutamate amidohydrolase
MSDIFQFTPGTTPLLISVPHAGTRIPADIALRMTPEALALPDTDWHVEKLYDFAGELGAGLIAADYSRYVVDLNRDPSGKPLYPGADNSEFVPLATFALEPIYKPGEEPDAAEIVERRAPYWQPYHDRLSAELARLKAEFGIAVLWDGHSILSHVPRFFEGRLPDLNLGSAKGTSAHADLVAQVMDILGSAEGFSSVLNGRFTGGYITRRYGKPADNIHALQLEMAEAVYLDESNLGAYDPERAARLKGLLKRTIGAVVKWAEAR